MRTSTLRIAGLLLLVAIHACKDKHDDSAWPPDPPPVVGGSPPDPGSLVPSFGDIGFVQSNPSSSVDEAYVIVRDATSMYVAGLYTAGPGDRGWMVEKRSLADGS